MISDVLLTVFGACLGAVVGVELSLWVDRKRLPKLNIVPTCQSSHGNHSSGPQRPGALTHNIWLTVRNERLDGFWSRNNPL